MVFHIIFKFDLEYSVFSSKYSEAVTVNNKTETLYNSS
jgi:hypothetical protein